jgi:hypothetical protein
MVPLITRNNNDPSNGYGKFSFVLVFISDRLKNGCRIEMSQLCIFKEMNSIDLKIVLCLPMNSKLITNGFKLFTCVNKTSQCSLIHIFTI